MCGRARCTLGVDDVGIACGFSAPLRTVQSDRFHASYNVSPGRYMPVVRHAQAGDSSAPEDSKEPIVHCMKWGLVPSFSKKNEKPDHFRMFNARSESVRLKSSFSRLLPKSRCLSAVEGFYEWKKAGAKKQPYYVHFKDGRPLVFAGLYDSWKDEEGNILYTFTILTTRSSKSLDWLHDRMPVILPNQEAVNSWLNDDLQESLLHRLTLPYEGSDLVWYPVTSAMGKPAFDSPECIKEIKPKVATDSKIAQLFGKMKHTESDSNREQEVLSGQCKEDPEVPAKEVSTSTYVDEGLLTDYDKKALLAGMEPDKEISQVQTREQEIDGKPGDLESNINQVNIHDQKSSDIPKQSVDYSPTKPEAGKDLSGAKRKRLSSSPKAGNKKGETPVFKDKQSSLLSFFSKG